MKNKIATLIVVFISITKAWAQDPSFTQFTFNKLYFNPAFCGDNNGFALGITGRSLWQSVPTGFYTSKISADWSFPLSGKICGLGLVGISDIEGEGFLSTYSIGIPIAVKLPICKSISIRFGIQPSYLQKSIDWTHLKFSNQYDPVNGLVRQNGLENSTGTNKNMYNFDFSSGTLGEYINTRNRYRSIRLGIAFYHMNRPDVTYYKTKRLPMKTVYHIDGTIATNTRNTFSLNPACIVEQQSDMKSILLGTNLFFTPYLKQQSFFVGLWYRRWRNSDAINIDVGIRICNNKLWKLLFYYNYDLTGSNMASTSGGSHEAGIIFEYDRSQRFKVQKMTAKKCSTDANGNLKNKTKTKRSRNKTKINKKSGPNIIGIQ